ncbi:MAG: CBS domain-containing protein [Coxiellaceae bacterium]|nr:CBS domain-containing protein [Coxiellaceae bacterium]
MVQYEALPIITLDPKKTNLCTDALPEVMHMDDPALAVMMDFTQAPPKTILEDAPIDDALNLMKKHGVHLLFAMNNNDQPVGVIASENILGEGPIKIQQERRIPRSRITVNMLMEKLKDIPALDIDAISNFKIGNIVNTLKKHHRHYAVVIKVNGDDTPMIRGIFTTSQISQQLHMDIAS